MKDDAPKANDRASGSMYVVSDFEITAILWLLLSALPVLA